MGKHEITTVFSLALPCMQNTYALAGELLRTMWTTRRVPRTPPRSAPTQTGGPAAATISECSLVVRRLCKCRCFKVLIRRDGATYSAQSRRPSGYQQQPFKYMNPAVIWGVSGGARGIRCLSAASGLGQAPAGHRDRRACNSACQFWITPTLFRTVSSRGWRTRNCCPSALTAYLYR
jgi:hypothetical protein